MNGLRPVAEIQIFVIQPLSAGWTLTSIGNIVTWEFVGYNMLIFYSALLVIPTELYEAARVDGAGPWSVFFRITMPMISPIMLLQVILQTTAALQRPTAR